jgi:squalene-hopene/tetraprenyl-beta-curcumene cyclase
MALDRMRKRRPTRELETAIARGREWIEGLLRWNGGWGAFDADNTQHYLNNIPFADHGALLDPPTEAVTARCVSMLAQLGERPETNPGLRAAVDVLRNTQLGDELHLRHLICAVRAPCRRP